MTKTKRNITILAVGERCDFDSYNKFDHEKKAFLNNGFEYISADYKHIFDGKIEKIKTKKVIIFLFFPFSYWSKYIEYKNYKGIYGSRIFFKKFTFFWGLVEDRIKKYFIAKEILFVNHPKICGIYRDKLRVASKLASAYIAQPKIYKMFRMKDIQKKLRSSHSLFLKPRYGSTGKGITVLSPSNWQTNFIFRDNKIVSRKSNRAWRFRDITGNTRFLSQLIKKDVLIEEAVDSLILKDYNVDFRIYTFFNKVIYIYPRKNKRDKIVTNISQGGRGDPSLLQMLPNHLIAKAKKIAVKVSRILGLNLMGIDIALDRNLKDAYVIDVNVFPGFPKKSTFNLTRCLIKELVRVRNRKRFHFEKGRYI